MTTTRCFGGTTEEAGGSPGAGSQGAGVQEQGTGAGGTGAAPGSAQGQGTEEGANEGEGNVFLADEDVPLSDGPEDLIRLDEEETPLAFRIDGLEGAKNMLTALVAGVSSIAAPLALFIILVKRRREENGKYQK